MAIRTGLDDIPSDKTNEEGGMEASYNVLPICATSSFGETSAPTPPVLEDTGAELSVDNSLEDLQEIVGRYAIFWGEKLGLDNWTITINYLDKFNYDTHQEFDPDYPLVMRNVTRWANQVTTIEVNYAECRSRTPEELCEDVLHELIHVVVNEMRWDVNRAPEKGHGCACDHDHEERVVTVLTTAMYSLYQDVVLG